MAVSATQIQLLRSSIANFRPDPNRLLPGQPAVNINATQPGLFFADNNLGLVKLGPAVVSSTAPNVEPAGFPGNTQGEFWFDTTVQTLKVYVGTEWKDCDPSEIGFTRVVIQTIPPPLDGYPNGALWWNDYNGEMYVLYEDPNGRQWVQVGAGGSAGGGAVIIAQQQPDPTATSVGTLWWNDETGSLFVLYNDGGPTKWWVQIAGAGAINGGQGGSVTSISAGLGLETFNGQPITTQGTILLKASTADEIGGVKPGANLEVEPDGTLNVVGSGTGTVTEIQTGPGLSGGPITTTGTLTLNSATSVQIGGVKPGAGTAVTGDGSLYVIPATNSSIGGVVVGEGLNVSPSGVLTVDAVPPGELPSGVVQWFASSTPPTGWLYCNGQTLPTASYPSLYAAIGRTYTGTSVPSTSFQVPDLRGQFLRGWDNRASGGVDSGRVFGSFQNDEFKQHQHTYYRSNKGGYGLTTTGFSSEQEAPTFNNPGGSETRPKNVALLPIIKI
jgi:microcystin-dependent protein